MDRRVRPVGRLALLTKTPGGFLALFVSALILGAWLTRRISWRQALIALALWALIAALTVFAFYPAFWTDPVGTLRTMLEVGERHVEGAIRPIFFRGQASYDPGPTFYPVVWLFRASPLVIVGVLIALVVYLRRPGPRRYDVIALIALALGFGLFVTLAGKKHDRYLLPAFMPLTLVAAWGWVEVGKSVSARLGNWDVFSNLPIPNLLIAPLILVQLFLILPYFSAPLGYFNPLLGGPRAALDWLEVGWGEGLGAAARWLNQHPDAKDLIVATSSIPPFAAFFIGQTVPLDGQTSYQADYIVCPPRQRADQLPLEPMAGAVVYEKTVGGVRYANVIRNPAPGEQIAYLEDHARQGDLILLDAEAALTHLYDGPADLAVLADARDPAEVAVRLEALIPGHERLWYVALPAASPITARHIQQQLACYGQPVSSDAVAGTAISQIALNNPQPCDATRSTQHATRSTFYVSRNSDALYLTDALLPGQPIAWPNQLPILVRWDALGPLPADYRTILHLKDEAGRIWAGGGQEILDADYRRPSAWAPGDWTDQTFQLTLPPGIPPGRYTVELGIFDPVSGRALSAWDAAGKFAGLAVKLGQVTVAPPPNPATPWDAVIPERLDPSLVAGHLTLLGHGPPPEQVPSGDRVSFDLFWQAMTAPDTDYSLRWRLHSIGGGIAAEESVPLSPYPSSRWRVRELVQVRYDLSASPDLPAGDYALAVNVLDSNSAPLWSEDVVLAEVEILARDRLFGLPTDIAYPLDVMLGDGVHLRGYNLYALSARPGDQLPLTLYWQADGPTDLSYTVFVHFVGPGGLLYGQSDHPPAGGTAPTHTWAPGQVVIDEVVLPVLADAPSGTYRIVVGLYNAVSGERLPVYDATGAELPNRQIVLPVEITVE